MTLQLLQLVLQIAKLNFLVFFHLLVPLFIEQNINFLQCFINHFLSITIIQNLVLQKFIHFQFVRIDIFLKLFSLFIRKVVNLIQYKLLLSFTNFLNMFLLLHFNFFLKNFELNLKLVHDLLLELLNIIAHRLILKHESTSSHHFLLNLLDFIFIHFHDILFVAEYFKFLVHLVDHKFHSSIILLIT